MIDASSDTYKQFNAMDRYLSHLPFNQRGGHKVLETKDGMIVDRTILQNIASYEGWGVESVPADLQRFMKQSKWDWDDADYQMLLGRYYKAWKRHQPPGTY